MPNVPVTIDASPALDAALGVLEYLEIADPPVTADRVLDGLRLTTESLADFDIGRLTPAQRSAYAGFGSIRGLLSPAEAKIYVAQQVTSRQMPWLVYHEAGHAAIDWHRETLYLDTHYTLSQRVIDLMEREANEFAGHLQFLGSRLSTEAQDLPLGLTSAIELADRYEASYESTIRRYVESCPTACICYVFRITRGLVVGDEGQTAGLRCQYYIRSHGYDSHWPIPYRAGHKLLDDDPFVRLLREGVLSDGVHCGTAFDPVSKTAYQYQTFCNGHSVFLLVIKAKPS